jgi:hypothetical protein
MSLLRTWWPLPVIVGSSLIVQKVFFESRYDVSGHAAEHLSSASAPFAAVVAVVILLYATPPARRQPVVLLASVAWLLSNVLVLIGNVRVIDALVRAGAGNVPTSQLEKTASIASAHDLANLAPLLGVLTALVLTGTLWYYGHLSGRVAIGAAVVSVIFPPWIAAGAGVYVATVARCITYQRTLRIEVAPPAAT